MAEINSLKFNLEKKKNQATMLQIAQIDVHMQIACLESGGKDQNLNRHLFPKGVHMSLLDLVGSS